MKKRSLTVGSAVAHEPAISVEIVLSARGLLVVGELLAAVGVAGANPGQRADLGVRDGELLERLRTDTVACGELLSSVRGREGGGEAIRHEVGSGKACARRSSKSGRRVTEAPHSPQGTRQSRWGR